jgi:hypothetical protein
MPYIKMTDTRKTIKEISRTLLRTRDFHRQLESLREREIQELFIELKLQGRM